MKLYDKTFDTSLFISFFLHACGALLLSLIPFRLEAPLKVENVPELELISVGVAIDQVEEEEVRFFPKRTLEVNELPGAVVNGCIIKEPLAKVGDRIVLGDLEPAEFHRKDLARGVINEFRGDEELFEEIRFGRPDVGELEGVGGSASVLDEWKGEKEGIGDLEEPLIAALIIDGKEEIDSPLEEELDLGLYSSLPFKVEISGPVRNRSVEFMPIPSVVPRWIEEMGINLVSKFKFWVAPDGTVDNIITERSSGFVRYDNFATSIIYKWRFSPILGDVSSRDWGVVKIKIKLK